MLILTIATACLSAFPFVSRAECPSWEGVRIVEASHPGPTGEAASDGGIALVAITSRPCRRTSRA
eukprot:4721970-Alexandrium_andersonii.AAC.1